MDLNICLYCEKLISDDDESSFCSTKCRNRESQQETAGGYDQYLSYFPNATVAHNSTPLPPSNYELAYHRRPSFSYSPISRRRPSSSLSSSSFNSISSSSTISFDNFKHFYPPLTEDTLSYPVYSTS